MICTHFDASSCQSTSLMQFFSTTPEKHGTSARDRQTVQATTPCAANQAQFSRWGPRGLPRRGTTVPRGEARTQWVRLGRMRTQRAAPIPPDTSLTLQATKNSCSNYQCVVFTSVRIHKCVSTFCGAGSTGIPGRLHEHSPREGSSCSAAQGRFDSHSNHRTLAVYYPPVPRCGPTSDPRSPAT